MQKRSKALVIFGFQTQDEKLTSFQKTWNQQRMDHGKPPVFRPTTSMDFLVARDKATKRPGFVEVELLPGETPMQAIHRMNPMSAAAIIRPWQEIDTFPYRENDNEWQVKVGLVLVHRDQREVDLYEQSDQLPFLVEWQTPGWLYLQQQDDLLNLLTSTALARSAVKQFFPTTQRREAA